MADATDAFLEAMTLMMAGDDQVEVVECHLWSLLPSYHLPPTNLSSICQELRMNQENSPWSPRYNLLEGTACYAGFLLATA